MTTRLRTLATNRLLLLGGLLAIVFLGVSVAHPGYASAQNIRDLLVQCAPVVIIGCAMTLVILTGEIDVSVGSMMGLLAAGIGILSSPERLGLPAGVVVAVVVAGGILLGCVNGMLVVAGRVPSIIVTLGMMTVLRGVTEILMGGEWITDLPASVRYLGTGEPLGLPLSIWTAMAAVVATVVVARKTPLGLHIYATGGNTAAAAMARVHVGVVRVTVFAIAGLMTAVATLVSVPQQSVIESGIGVGFELLVITAVVVGGTSISGGYGGVAGTVLAALLLANIRPALLYLDLGDRATFWERAIQGAFILAAVLSDRCQWFRRADGKAVTITTGGSP